MKCELGTVYIGKRKG